MQSRPRNAQASSTVLVPSASVNYKNYKVVSCLAAMVCGEFGKRFSNFGPKLARAVDYSDRQLDFQLWIESLIGPGRS
jgi:hypothetical protein